MAHQVPGGALNAGQMVLERQPVWSDAGQITIQAATALLMEGRLMGQGGGPQGVESLMSSRPSELREAPSRPPVVRTLAV